MAKYLLKRILMMIPTIMAVILVVFLMLYYVPQGRVTNIVAADQTLLNHLFSFLHIPEGLFTQYIRYVWNLFTRLDMGVSARSGVPVSSEVLYRGSYTIRLTVLGLIFTALVSVPLGIHSALHRGKWIDSAISFFTQLFSSVPSYCFAIFLVLLFALRLKLLPSFYTDSIRGHILPVLMISINGIAQTTKIVRATVLETLDQQFITALRSKGLRERIVIYRHALKNSLISILSVLRATVTKTLSSTLIAEMFFSIPGLGYYLLNAVNSRNTIQILGCTVIIAVILMSINIVSDLLYIWADPQLRSAYK
ncbi:MAG: ABC transporter permease [Solobacterium sp.]|nr:ABC transporter permease [Solobacterium sp.]